MKKMLIAVIVFGVTIMSLMGDTVKIGDFSYSYSLSTKEATLTGYSGSSSHVTIPTSFTVAETYKDDDGETHTRHHTITVTSIGSSAFANNTAIKYVSFHDAIKTIGNSAFSRSGIESVKTPSSLTSIGSNAFASCGDLEEAEIDGFNLSIGNIFDSCPRLRRVVFGDGITTLASGTGVSGWVAFRSGVFPYCTNLQSVVVGRGVTSVPMSLFAAVGNSTYKLSVSFASPLVSIGERAFYNGNITNCDINVSRVTSISEYAFYGCVGLRAGLDLQCVTSIGQCAFYGSSVRSVKILSSLTSIGSNAFASCGELEEAEIDGCNLSIGNIFDSCPRLRRVVFGDGITTLASGTGVSGWVAFRSGVFPYCTNLQSVVVGRGVTSVPMSLFAAVGSSTCKLSVSFSSPLVSIGERAFYNGNITNCDINVSRVTSISEYAFYGCVGLRADLDLQCVTSIGQYAFYGHNELAAAKFGSSLTSIGQYAFSGCANASSFAFAGTPPNVGSSAFKNVKSGAVGTYTAEHAAAWEAVIDDKGYWNGLKMKPSYPKLSASDGTVPGGIEVTWTDDWCVQHELFRGESENGPFTRIATVSGNKYFDSDFSDSSSSAKWGQPYWYYVNRVSGQKGAQPKDGTQRDSNVDVGLTKSGSELPMIEDVDVGELWLSGEGPYYCFLTWNNFDKERYYVSSITFNLKRSGSRVPVWTSAPKVSLGEGNQIEVFDVSQDNQFLVPRGQHGQHLLEVTWEVSDRQTHQVLEKVTQPCKEPRICDDVKVFFHKYGTDHDPIPNWCYYWPENGAILSKDVFGTGTIPDDDSLFRFNPGLPASTRGLTLNPAPSLMKRRRVARNPPGMPPIYRLDGKCDHQFSLGIDCPTESSFIKLSDKLKVGSNEVGLKKLAVTISHEKKHAEIAGQTFGDKGKKGWLFIGNGPYDDYKAYDFGRIEGLVSYLIAAGCDSSTSYYRDYYSAIVDAMNSGKYVTDFDGDGIADTEENEGGCYYDDWRFSNEDPDTYDFNIRYEYAPYANYGDNEVLARDAEKHWCDYMGSEKADWAWPGYNLADRNFELDGHSIVYYKGKYYQNPSRRDMMSYNKAVWEEIKDLAAPPAQRMSRKTKSDMSEKILAAQGRSVRFTKKQAGLLKSGEEESEIEDDVISYWHGTASKVSDISVSTGDVYVVSCADAGVVRDGSGRVSSLGWSLVLTNATDEAMTVKLRSYLSDSATNALAWAATNVECAVGLTTVEMRFDAEDIFLWDTSRLMLYAVTIESSVGDMGWMVSEQAPCALTAAEFTAADLANDKGRIVPSSVAVIATSEGVMVTGKVERVSGDAAQIYASLTETNGLAVTSAMIDAPGVGANDFSIFFPGDELYRLAKPLPYVVDSVRLAENGETVHEINDAGTVDAEDARWFRPADLTIHALAGSGAWSEPLRGADGLCSQITYSFVVSNAEDTVKACHARATLLGTNEEHVCSLNLPVELSAGLNMVSMSFSSIDMKAHEYDGGVYRIGNVFIESDDGNEIEVLHTDGNSIAVARNELAGVPFMVKGTPQFCYREAGGTNRASVVVTVEVARPDTITASVLLVDGEGKYVATARTSETVGAAGEQTLTLTFDPAEVKASGRQGPYTISYLLLKSGNEGVEDVRVEDFVVRDVLYLEQVAPPSFSPATKTVFFRREQTVSISCATDAAEIRYTLDGSEPTTSSRLYDGAFIITNSVIVKTKAFVEGLSPSETVVAEYVRAAIVGDNLVQTASPTSGVAQVVSVPVPGTYQVSFGWEQGGAFELRLSKGGDVRTIAAISAENAGTTNLLFDISTAGDYELMVYAPSSGVTQPAVVSNLSLSIPDTPENKGRYWIYETEDTYGSTGEWSGTAGFKNGKMPIIDSNTFTSYMQSNGGRVEITFTIEFGELGVDDPNDMPDDKAGIGMVKDAFGENVFQVFTSEHGENVWKSVYAEGLGAPMLGTPYTVKLTLDFTNGTYTIALVSNETEMPLTDGTTGTFAIANSHDPVVKAVKFWGDSGNIISLLGNYGDSASRFAEGDTLNLSGGAIAPPLTEHQAAWLNSMKGYEAVKAKVATMGLADFNDAYLLNLDISQSEFGLGMFKVTGIEVTEEVVRITVTLNRAGAMQVSRGGMSRDAPINGLLKLYGGATLGDRTLLNATVITDDSFSSGDTEVFTYPRSGPARFFCPAIVSP